MSGLCERCHENVPATNDDWCSECILEVETALAEAEEELEVEEHERELDRQYYTMEDLERRVAEYEDEYGLPSDALLGLHRNDLAPLDLPGFERHVWLSYYRELLENNRR